MVEHLGLLRRPRFGLIGTLGLLRRPRCLAHATRVLGFDGFAHQRAMSYEILLFVDLIATLAPKGVRCVAPLRGAPVWSDSLIREQ